MQARTEATCSCSEPVEAAGEDIRSLQQAFAAGLQPAEHLRGVYRRIEALGVRPVWISLMPEARALAMLEAAFSRRAAGEALPLLGLPFAVKDNIDVAGLPTTAGCPDFAYTPDRSAAVVAGLIAAGAIPIGKTNLDQFATGLNGTRSPYGIPACVFDARYVSGGSSSGSAVAVALGLVPFALGTDTAGSGRVPAAFNNIVGLKPTKGLLSTAGVIPAARSQDCVSVFAGTVGDALAVARVAAGFDPADAYSRRAPAGALDAASWGEGFRFGVPAAAQLAYFGDDAAAALFAQAAARLEALGGVRVEVDYAPFRDAAELLYAGPWVAERLAAIKDFAAEKPDPLHPVVREVIASGAGLSAVDAFEGQYRLADCARAAEAQWQLMDVMLLPTAGTLPAIEAVLADPIELNADLGFYTNFVNLLDLCAAAVPAGFRPNGLPFGVSLIGRAFEDGRIASLADSLHRAFPGATLGASGRQLPERGRVRAAPAADRIAVAVVGAHLSGEPLNYQLTERSARLRGATRTAAGYSLYALAGTAPARPGLVRDGVGRGCIAVEIWDVPAGAFGSFVAEIPAPLAIGTVALEDGSTVKGFLCESHALLGAEDITHFGGWRPYCSQRASSALSVAQALSAQTLLDSSKPGALL